MLVKLRAKVSDENYPHKKIGCVNLLVFIIDNLTQYGYSINLVKSIDRKLCKMLGVHIWIIFH